MHIMSTALHNIPLCMHSGFPSEKVEQMIVMSFYDVTMISHAIREGTICDRSTFSGVAQVH